MQSGMGMVVWVGVGPTNSIDGGGRQGLLDQLGQETSDLTELLMNDPGSLMSMGFMGGPNGAADSWSARLNLDPEVG